MSSPRRSRNSAEASAGGIAQAGNGTNIVITQADAVVVQVAVEVTAAWAEIREQYVRQRLEDRAPDLRQLANFLQANISGWWGWRGEAWAGKTRLMAEVACNPPDGWKPVAFFARRGTRDNNEKGFLRSVLVQLAAIAGQDVLVLGADATAQRAQLRLLLRQAVEACASEGRRLLLIVDGLDEDEVYAGDGDRSIAALLPGQDPPCMVLVSGRPAPALRLPAGHRLAEAEYWHTLSSVKASAAARDAARADLRVVLNERVGLSAAALCAVTRHALTPQTLASMTGYPKGDYLELFSRTQARSFTPVATSDPEGVGYVLAHANLYDMLIEHLDPDAAYGPDSPVQPMDSLSSPAGLAALEPWRKRVGAWAEKWAEKGWPANTPAYLLRNDILGLLDQPVLVDTLTDPRRHARISSRLGSPAPALTQLRGYLQQLIPRWRGDLEAPPTVDFVQCGRLLFALHDLDKAGGRIPANLPAVFARIGQHDLAEQLLGATNGAARAGVDVAQAYLAIGDSERALAAARRVMTDMRASPSYQPNLAEMNQELTALLMTLDAFHEAKTVASAIPDHDEDHQNTIAAKAACLGMVGLVEQAVAVTGRLELGGQYEAVRKAALAAHQCGNLDAARQLLRAAAKIADEVSKLRFYSANLVPEYAQVGLLDDAHALAEAQESSTRSTSLVWLAEWNLQQDEQARADRAATSALAGLSTDPSHDFMLTRLMTRLSVVLIRLSRYEDAAEVISHIGSDMEAQGHARVTMAYHKAGLRELAAGHFSRAMAPSGDRRPWPRLRAIYDIVVELSQWPPSGWLETVVRETRAAVDGLSSDDREIDRLLRHIAENLAWRGHHEASAELADLIPTENEWQRADVRFDMSKALAAGPSWRLATDMIDQTHAGPEQLADVAEVLAEGGHVDAAQALATRALQPHPATVSQASVPNELAYALGAHGRLAVAVHLAGQESPYRRDELMLAAGVAAARADLDGAKAHLLAIPDRPGHLAAAFVGLALVALRLSDDGQLASPVPQESRAGKDGGDGDVLVERRVEQGVPTSEVRRDAAVNGDSLGEATADGHGRTDEAPDVALAIELLGLAVERLDISPGGENKQPTIDTIAHLYAVLGKHREAKALILGRLAITDQAAALAKLACVLTSAGHRTQAADTAATALAVVCNDLEAAVQVYYLTSLVASWHGIPLLRSFAVHAAEAAYASLPPIVNTPLTGRRAAQGYNYANAEVVRRTSIVIEALLSVGKRGTARHLIRELHRNDLEPDMFQLVPSVAVHDSTDAAIGLLERATTHNRQQPLERALARLVIAGRTLAAYRILDHISDVGDQAQAYLQLADHFAKTGRPDASRASIDRARVLIPQAALHRQCVLHAWTAQQLLDLMALPEASLHLQAAVHCVSQGTVGYGAETIGACAKVATDLGLEPAARRLLVSGWVKDGHPMNLWHLLFELAPDEAAALATQRWGVPASPAANTGNATLDG